jgi:DNA-binding NarL/FixJ family response regulator
MTRRVKLGKSTDSEAIIGYAMLRPMRMAGPPTTITPRMREVLTLMADGKTNREIAYELGLSPFTVRNYIERIFERLGAMDRVQAVSKALREGIID